MGLILIGNAAQPPTAFSVNKPPQVVSQPQISGSGQIPCHSRLAHVATGPCHSVTFALPQAATVVRLLFAVTVFFFFLKKKKSARPREGGTSF
jgi:hypothetical protein